MSYWRIGDIRFPFSFSPQSSSYPWTNRFDDVFRQFRSLYCAKDMKTCFRELLADLRPNEKAKMDFEKIFGGEDLPLAQVRPAWYQSRALVHVEPRTNSGDFVDIETIKERFNLLLKYKWIFLKRGVLFPDIKHLRKKDRSITQQIARGYFDEGRAGISFNSHLDRQNCLALFEGRAVLVNIDEPITLSPDMTAFQEVCSEFQLQIV